MLQPESFAKCACQNCGGHIEFPLQGAGQKTACPHCGEPTLLTPAKTPTVEVGGGPAARKRIFTMVGIAAVVVLAAAAGAYFFLNPNPNRNLNPQPLTNHPPDSTNAAAEVAAPVPPPKPKPPTDPWHGLKVSKVSLEKTGDGRLIYAIGTVTNETPRQRFGVKVDLELEDEHHNKLGTATDYTDVIEPNKIWKFRALVTARTATAAKLTGVREQE